MITLEHQVLVELFRDQPALAVELLRICAGIDLGPAVCELGSIDLGQVAPTEYRADAVVILRDANHEAIGAIIVEVQRAIDADKRWTWPLYVSALRANTKCPVTLLVIAPSPSVARWARQPIDLGHPHFSLRPIAIATDDIPAAPISSSAELLVLAALAHPEQVDPASILDAISELPDDRRRLYFDLVMAAAPAAIRAMLESTMLKNYEYKSDFARKYYGDGQRANAVETLRKLGRAKLGVWSSAEDDLVAKLGYEAIQILTDALISAGDPAEARTALDRAAAL